MPSGGVSRSEGVGEASPEDDCNGDRRASSACNTLSHDPRVCYEGHVAHGMLRGSLQGVHGSVDAVVLCSRPELLIKQFRLLVSFTHIRDLHVYLSLYLCLPLMRLPATL